MHKSQLAAIPQIIQRPYPIYPLLTPNGQVPSRGTHVTTTRQFLYITDCYSLLRQMRGKTRAQAMRACILLNACHLPGQPRFFPHPFQCRHSREKVVTKKAVTKFFITPNFVTKPPTVGTQVSRRPGRAGLSCDRDQRLLELCKAETASAGLASAIPTGLF